MPTKSGEGVLVLQNSTKVAVTPTVLLSICDSYVRRNEGQQRVIGTLLGTVDENGLIDVRNSYAVPHNESNEQVALDIDFHRTMLDLNQRVNAKEVIIGWYSTGDDVVGSDVLIQDFYSRDVPHPVHLVVDTQLTAGNMGIRAYTSHNLVLGGAKAGARFEEVPCEIRMQEVESLGTDLLKSGMVEKLPTDLEGLKATLERLQGLVGTVKEHVDGVVEGKIEPDNKLGRFLAETLELVPNLDHENFEKLFSESVSDVLMVMYLTNLCRTQLVIAEQLGPNPLI